MKLKKLGLLWIFIVSSSVWLQVNAQIIIDPADNAAHTLDAESCNPCKGKLTYAGAFVVDCVKDILAMHRNLLDWDTYKVFVGTFPFYITGAMFEKELHEHSYCRQHHRNLNQMHHGLHKFAIDFSVITVITFGLANFFFSRDERMRETGKLVAIGMPFVIWMADLIKVFIKTDLACRPWHEDFSCKERSFGGFPSTHGAQLGYATLLFGLQHGVRYAAPLALLTIFVGASCFNGNRHYVSQYIAGVGLGAMYACAASKVVDAKIAESMDINFALDARGNPAVQLSIPF